MSPQKKNSTKFEIDMAVLKRRMIIMKKHRQIISKEANSSLLQKPFFM